MFRIAIELPFLVLLVHKKEFPSEGAAIRYIRRHYKRFPALAVFPAGYVENWKGTVFQFPAHWNER